MLRVSYDRQTARPLQERVELRQSRLHRPTGLRRSQRKPLHSCPHRGRPGNAQAESPRSPMLWTAYFERDSARVASPEARARKWGRRDVMEGCKARARSHRWCCCLPVKLPSTRNAREHPCEVRPLRADNGSGRQHCRRELALSGKNIARANLKRSPASTLRQFPPLSGTPKLALASNASSRLETREPRLRTAMSAAYSQSPSKHGGNMRCRPGKGRANTRLVQRSKSHLQRGR
jgi:hypothetical protein